jgi:hypothetical protein
VTEPGGRTSTPPAGPPDDRRGTVAGVILVAFALLIGVVLLAKGFGDDGGLTNTATKSDQSSDSGNGQGFDVPTTATTLPAVDPATVKAMVANASGTKTGARKVADFLGTKGYAGVQVGNAPNQTQSVIYVTAGNAAEGQAVAAALGLDPALVSAMPTSPPVNDLKGANVLVVIGTDGKLADPGATTTTTAAGTTDSSA